MVPSSENIEGNQSIQIYSHAQRTLQPQTCVQKHCSDQTGHVLSVFPATLTSLLFVAALESWHSILH